MWEQVVRGFFSFIAATVFLATAYEWSSWALERREYWRFLPAVFLAAMAVFEAGQVWRRADALLKLLG